MNLLTQLVFATHNVNKISEVRELLPDWISIKTPSDLGFIEDIPENGVTFHENAQQKAYHLYEHLLDSVFAEDSGLEIDVLDGRPGIYSARYAGIEKNDDDNIKKVLEEMSGYTLRTARFKTVICLILNGEQYFFEGVVPGCIAIEKRGNKGFGYDPIFVPEGETRTFSEMNLSEKNSFSHRANALHKMIQFLSS